jgi:hypothetical protein
LQTEISRHNARSTSLSIASVKQKKDEDPETFADRVHTLAKKTLTVSHSPAIQDACNTECEK